MMPARMAMLRRTRPSAVAVDSIHTLRNLAVAPMQPDQVGKRDWQRFAAALALTGSALSNTIPARCERDLATSPCPIDSNVDDVGYVTDIEGDLATFERYVGSEQSVLCRGPDGVLELRGKTSAFVFGGDLFDRGPGDLRLARELLSLKKRYPDRVVLLMGNRDINKMRFTAELDIDIVGNGNHDNAFYAFWDAKAPTLSTYLSSQKVPDTREHRLRWMLRHTLGSPNTFEHRRVELAELHATSVTNISDEQVVESLTGAVEKDTGEVAAYLRSSQIGAIIGDTLFVHGAVEQQAIGFVPSRETRYKRNSSEELLSLPGVRKGLPLRDWVEALNMFAAEEVAEWRKNPFWRKDGTRAGEALMAYQSRPAMAFQTVVVTCYVDGKNMPTRKAIDIDKFEGHPKCSDPANAAVCEYLLDGGVRRVVVGHKPSGDAPAVLRIAGPDGLGFEVISADTNYASTKTEDLRGGSWCEVRVSVPTHSGAPSRARLRGYLADGAGTYDFCLQALGKAEDAVGDPLVGCQTFDGWWVRVRLDPQDCQGQGEHDYLLSRGSGRHAEYRRVSADQLKVAAAPPGLMPQCASSL